MTEQEWMLKVENKLGKIGSDIEYIKTMLPLCDSSEIKSALVNTNSKIKLNRWVIGGLFLAIIALMGVKL